MSFPASEPYSASCHHDLHTLAWDIHRDGPFEACGTCAFLWCKVLTWPHPQTRGNSAYNITLTILYINYIHCLLSITCNKTTYFCRSLIHGNITYSKHKDHVTLITIYLWIPPPFFFHVTILFWSIQFNNIYLFNFNAVQSRLTVTEKRQ